jgi:prepilin-type N-terminal cleavage/methylation domain-containing protein
MALNKNMKEFGGFTLVEVLVVMGILSLLVASALFIGFPEYNRHIIYSERDYLVDTFLESRARSLVSNESFFVSVWSNGYCIKDVLGLCVDPVHNLPSNMMLISTSLPTSTKIVIAFATASLESVLRAEINIDQNGFVIEQ